MEKVEEKQKSWKEKGRLYTSREGKNREERAGGIRVKNRINSRFDSFSRELKEQEVSEPVWTELTQDLIPSKEILYQLLQLNFGQVHLKRLHEKSREEKGKESEGWRR